MGWNAYKLVYKAESPVHIGHHKLGFIRRTRYYITGRNMWGAFTANLARTIPLACKLDDHYGKIGRDLVNDSIRFTYFYPVLDSGKPLLPTYTPEGLKYGCYSSDAFERRFICFSGQTAILPMNLTAEEGSLHETEYIAPVVDSDNNQGQVYFEGYLFIKEGACYNNESAGFDDGDIRLKEVFNEIFIGGEKRYGFGRLVLCSDKCEQLTENNPRLFGHRFIRNDTKVKVKIDQCHTIPAHLSVKSGIQLKGDIEPLVGREWGTVLDKEKNEKSGAGQKISQVQLCWVPGSVLLDQEEVFTLDKFGVLFKEGI